MTKLTPEDEEAVRRLASWKHRGRESTPADSGALDPQHVYAEMMKTILAPALRNAGLMGSGGRFELPSDTHWAQLGFQKSAFNGHDELRFTVNLSVIRRDEWDTQAALKPYLGNRPTPNTHYGTWAAQARIGELTPDGEDKWWRITRGAEATVVGDDALADLLSYGVPWLRQHATG